MDDLAGFIALALAPGIGPARLRTLLKACGSPDGAFSAPFAFLCSLPGFSRTEASAVRAASREEAAKIIEGTAALGGQILTMFDARFPQALRRIPHAPVLLFTAGDLSLLDRPAVAIVGSRDHSAYGATVCRLVAARAAEAGIVVVSGMARGLDATAHGAALDVGGGSIGVLGNGLGVIYPAANRALYDRMRQGGLLITEFGVGERPNTGSFQRRNRLICGLARVTVVIEAAAKSGTLITVDAALEQGKDVMAVPGAITSRVSVGTNRLLRDGAAPLLEPDDLFSFFPEITPPPTRLTAGAGDPSTEPLPPDLSADERAVASLMGGDAVQLDELATRCARPVAELLAVLSSLEVRGVVRQEPGQVFRR